MFNLDEIRASLHIEESNIQEVQTTNVSQNDVDDYLNTLVSTSNASNTETSVEESNVEETTEEVSEEVPTISENSSLIDETTIRFSSALWFNETYGYRITLIGIGGINSWTALLLAKLRPNNITLVDPDNVEETNIAGQLYKINDVGSYKANSLSRTIEEYAAYYNYNCITTEASEDIISNSDIIICGLDNMASRKFCFDAFVDSNTPRLFIDGRLSADSFQIFCIKKDDIRAISEYKEKYLFSDEEADATVCSYKQTAYMAAMIGSFITNVFINYITNCKENLPIYTLPFKTEYDSRTMILKRE